MSKHTSRKSRWIDTGLECYSSSCGTVRKNVRGKWDATLKFKIKIKDKFYNQSKILGEYKRAREAMIVVEDCAVRMFRENNSSVDLDPSLQR